MAREGSLAARSVERALAARQAAYMEDVTRLIEAAHCVMERTGNFDPSVSAILKEAELSNQAFYRHFQSKEALLIAVVDDGTRRLRAYLERRMAGKADPLERIREWVRGFARQAINPKAARATRPFVIPSARLLDRFPREIGAAEAELIAPLAAAVKEALLAHTIRSDIDPARDALFVYDLTKDWLARQLIEKQLPSAAHMTRSARSLEDFILAGLGAR